MIKYATLLFVLVYFLFQSSALCQLGAIEKEVIPWHGIERSIRYQPDGTDFIIVNGNRRFNRALYGTNTGYRVEAGDLPEFAQYLPDMGGNLKFGIISTDTSKWLIDADHILARYRPGTMIYEIEDKLLGEGNIRIIVLAMAEADGMIVKVQTNNLPVGTEILWAFGGVSGVKFSRDGDIGADPESSFYLKPEYCRDNIYDIDKARFSVYYIPRKTKRKLDLKEWRAQSEEKKKEIMRSVMAIFPVSQGMHLADANKQTSPDVLLQSKAIENPVFVGKFPVEDNKEFYFSSYKPVTIADVTYEDLPELFEKAEIKRKELANRVKVSTPDPYINTLGGALVIAADAVYQDPSFLHGAVAWRMWLNGWRGAYVADVLGWHNRAKAHFRGYAQSQVTEPASGPAVPDTFRHFARQKEEMGTALFSNGYVCRNPNGQFRPHHYDMNLVFFDQLLTHFNYTGDVELIKEMWPVINRHLAWEKRNFDPDDDGLYDAYCCIWASDAVQYNGGSVAHSSAYNYRAYNMIAKLAEIIGEDPTPYREEAEKTLSAINSQLWMPEAGRYAEFKDRFGLQKVHPNPAIWTLYHTIDSDVPDAFQAYQCTRYIDSEIPHIPIIAEGLEGHYYTISTSSWMPYTWSVNNVALAEVMHTALAYWQTGRNEEAYTLWKSALMESMYLGASPGNIQQLSFYDAMRGELYRDFADAIGMTARTLVEGLFGIHPYALDDTLIIEPGFPQEWEHASIETPDMKLHFKREGNKDIYSIEPVYYNDMKLVLKTEVKKVDISKVLVNGDDAQWKSLDNSVGKPQIEIYCDENEEYLIEIVWGKEDPERIDAKYECILGSTFNVSTNAAEIIEVYDPQYLLVDTEMKKNQISAGINSPTGSYTVFVKLQQNDMQWWSPINVEITGPVKITRQKSADPDELTVKIQNHSTQDIEGSIWVNSQKTDIEVKVKAGTLSSEIYPPNSFIIPGSNIIEFKGSKVYSKDIIINWNIIGIRKSNIKTIDLSSHCNDKVTQIFKNKYLTPRSQNPTLSTPWQGIGNWCYPFIQPGINDSGLRVIAGSDNQIELPQGIPFVTPSDTNENNILFVTQWDNYPREVKIPLNGKAIHAYFLMTGTTNPMQSRFTNGEIVITYKDGSQTILLLNNPDSWWPIEQDYYLDGYAFNIDTPKPIRVHLKSGLITRDFDNYCRIEGFSKYAIEGGAATVYDLPLDPDRSLESLTLRAVANEVVIGLMSVTLITK